MKSFRGIPNAVVKAVVSRKLNDRNELRCVQCLPFDLTTSQFSGQSDEGGEC